MCRAHMLALSTEETMCPRRVLPDDQSISALLRVELEDSVGIDALRSLHTERDGSALMAEILEIASVRPVYRLSDAEIS